MQCVFYTYMQCVFHIYMQCVFHIYVQCAFHKSLWHYDSLRQNVMDIKIQRYYFSGRNMKNNAVIFSMKIVIFYGIPH